MQHETLSLLFFRKVSAFNWLCFFSCILPIKLFHYLVLKLFLQLELNDWCASSSVLLLLLSDKLLKVLLFFLCRFRFKLTTIKFAVIENRAAQESIYRVYACHQTQRHNQLPQWDSTPNSKGRNRRESATVMDSLLTHKGTVFHLVQLVATHHRAVTQWNNLNNTNQFQWPHQVSFPSFLH